MKIYFFSKKNLKKTCKSSSLNLCIANIRINGCYMSNIKNKLFTYRFVLSFTSASLVYTVEEPVRVLSALAPETTNKETKTRNNKFAGVGPI